MKYKANLLEQLKPLPHFSQESLFLLGKQLGLSDSSISTYISRFLKCKDILQLKRGLYTTSDFLAKNRADVSYSFYLANVIRTPSYISSWSALQFYNLATEAVYDITSVTPKVTRNYQTKVGHFTYQSIRRDLFSGFSLIQGNSVDPLTKQSEAGKFSFFIASPAKALFDLLYFRTRQFRGLQEEDIKGLVEELRIDIDEMDEKEREDFYLMVKEHIRHE